MLPLPPAQALLSLTALLCVGGAAEYWLAAWLGADVDRGRPDGREPPLIVPAMRCLTVLVAVIATYPAVFGLRAATSVGELLRLHPGTAGTLVAGLLVTALLATRLPWTARRAAALFTLQGGLVMGFLFEGLREDLGARSASAWPSPWAAAALCGLALLLPRLAGALGRELGGLIDRRFGTLRVAHACGAFYERLASAAVLTLYGYLVGQQLGI